MTRPKHFDMPDDYNPFAGPSPADDFVEKYYVPELNGTQGWVRRAADKAKEHVCQPPVGGAFACAAGSIGDLWRCRCGALWRVDRIGPTRGALGWFSATLWQRIRYWKAMR